MNLTNRVYKTTDVKNVTTSFNRANRFFMNLFKRIHENNNSKKDYYDKISLVLKETEGNIFKCNNVTYLFSDDCEWKTCLAMCVYNESEKTLSRNMNSRTDFLKFNMNYNMNSILSNVKYPKTFNLTETYIYANQEQLSKFFEFIKSFERDLILKIDSAHPKENILTKDDIGKIISGKSDVKGVENFVFWSNDLKTIINPTDFFNIDLYKFCYPVRLTAYSINDLGHYDITDFDKITFSRVDYETDYILPICKNLPKSDVLEIQKVKSTHSRPEFFTKELEDSF